MNLLRDRAKLIMSINYNQLLFSVPAFLWDDRQRLSGMLELWNLEIVFRFNDYKGGHLSLEIPLDSIETVEVFLIYNFARHGLKVQTREGKFDLFVLEEASVFKEKLERQLVEIDKQQEG